MDSSQLKVKNDVFGFRETLSGGSSVPADPLGGSVGNLNYLMVILKRVIKILGV